MEVGPAARFDGELCGFESCEAERNEIMAKREYQRETERAHRRSSFPSGSQL